MGSQKKLLQLLLVNAFELRRAVHLAISQHELRLARLHKAQYIFYFLALKREQS